MQRETEALQIPPTTTGGVNIRSIISLVLEQLAFWQKHDPEFRFAPFFVENSARLLLQTDSGIFFNFCL